MEGELFVVGVLIIVLMMLGASLFSL